MHWLLGCQPNSPFHSLCKELGILKNNRFQILKEFSSFLNEKTGQKLVVTFDLKRLANDMKTMAPEDEKIIDEFIAGCHIMQGVFHAPKPELVEFLKDYNMPVVEFAKSFKNHYLRWYITHMMVPQMPTYAMLFTLGLLADGQLGLVEGGSLNFSLAIAQYYQDLQGEITYGARVEEILVKNSTVIGIRLADGSEHRADVVVSAADGFSTIFQMLGGKYVDQSIRERYAQWPIFWPIHLISFGVARQFPNEPPVKKILLKEPIHTGVQDTDNFRLRIFNYDPSLAPEGKTVVQVLLDTDFDHWYHLQENRALYEAAKAKLAHDVLRRLETLYPGISSQVEITDVATPYTFWRYTRNHRGSFEGWLPTPEAMRTTIPKTLPGLANFYMVGQWVQPAGGIEQSISSGRNLVKTLCEQEAMEFSTVKP
ncbi:phytoene desaturase family protein [Desulfotomaculum sp. 1211_IL3151]|uniref:phytoene desaturase family protein n=1 Tax=Desulfotomaculum sp. 1211_IL3151 TaxID=3084055 RepID=UPI002FDA6F76